MRVQKNLAIFQRQYECALEEKDLKSLIGDVCRHCQLCQGLKANKGVQNKALEIYQIPPQVFHSLAMDFVDMPYAKVGGEAFDFALVVVCRLSGYIVALPC